MDPMSEYLARAVMEARLAAAQEARRGRDVASGRLAERRSRRRSAIKRWRQARFWRRSAAVERTMAMAAPPPVRPPSVEVAQLLTAAAYHVAERGTASERRLLEVMSEVSAPSAPGAAAALVDWAGSEASRQRAFGLVHAHLVDVLGPREHAWLLDILEESGHEAPGRVA